jgi:hypothetical protein
VKLILQRECTCNSLSSLQNASPKLRKPSATLQNTLPKLQNGRLELAETKQLIGCLAHFAGPKSVVSNGHSRSALFLPS